MSKINPYEELKRLGNIPMVTKGLSPCFSALTFRNWKTRIKGRDWYDFEWYVSNSIPLNFSHLQKRIYDFNGIEMTKEEFLNTLKNRLATGDIASVKQDVLRFLRADPRELDIWSNDYFLQLADKIVFCQD